MNAVGGFHKLSRSPSFKFVLVVFLVFAVSLPLAVVWLLLSERQSRALSVQAEVAANWGGEQRILGPYLIVPYTVKVKSFETGKAIETEQERVAVFLPDTLNVSADVKTEVRQRSIYNVTVYRSDIGFEGHFAAANIALADPQAAVVRWRDAILALAISDVSGLKNNVALEAGGVTAAFEPSIGIAGGAAAYLPGIHARLDLSSPFTTPPQTSKAEAPPFDYRFRLSLNGSSSLTFAPAGRDTGIAMTSSWPHPSFKGFLPVERKIGPSGFEASWRVPYLARSVPQYWSESAPSLILDRFGQANMGVELFVPVDFYSLVDRALKYGFMFISAAFGAVFVIEVLSDRRLHPIQYFFAGLAMVMFYILVLSFSEHIGFSAAYAIAASATGGMLSLYAGRAFGSARRGATMLALFAILYGLLYLILQLEDYALLAGALTGFVLLTVTMFATLRVNWSGDDTQPYSQ